MRTGQSRSRQPCCAQTTSDVRLRPASIPSPEGLVERVQAVERPCLLLRMAVAAKVRPVPVVGLTIVFQFQYNTMHNAVAQRHNHNQKGIIPGPCPPSKNHQAPAGLSPRTPS